MRAVVARNKELVVETIADPSPGPGQVVVKSLSCGICGSDLHALHSLDRMLDVALRSSFSLARSNLASSPTQFRLRTPRGR